MTAEQQSLLRKAQASLEAARVLRDVTVHRPGDWLIFRPLFALPSTSGGRPKNVPVPLGRRGQSHFRGEKGPFRESEPTAPRKLGQSPVNGYAGTEDCA